MRVWLFRLTSLMVLSVLQAVSALAAEQGCALQTLNGSYVFSSRGWSKLEQKGYRPVAYIGMLSFDGKGKVSAKFRAENEKATQSVSGSYTLGANCEADVTLKNGRKATYFVSPDGNGFSFVVTSGLVASGDAHRVSKEALVKDKPVAPAAKPKKSKPNK